MTLSVSVPYALHALDIKNSKMLNITWHTYLFAPFMSQLHVVMTSTNSARLMWHRRRIPYSRVGISIPTPTAAFLFLV